MAFAIFAEGRAGHDGDLVLLQQADGLKPLLQRHGITLRRDVLEDRRRTFLRAVQERKRRQLPVTGALHRTLDRLERAVASQPD